MLGFCCHEANGRDLLYDRISVVVLIVVSSLLFLDFSCMKCASKHVYSVLFSLKSTKAATKHKRTWCHQFRFPLNSPSFSPNEYRVSLLCCAVAWIKFSCYIKPFHFSRVQHLPSYKWSILSFTYQTGAKQFLTQNFKNTVMPTLVCQKLYRKVICMSNNIKIISTKANWAQWPSKICSHFYIWE